MRSLFLSLAVGSLLCGSCAQSYRDTTLYQISGRQKPVVAVLPVIDNTSENQLTWDLSRELTDEIRKRIYDSKRIYLLRDGGSLEIAEQLNRPNIQSISKVAVENLGCAQFALVAEVIEQDEKSYGINCRRSDHPMHEEVGSVLSLALRVRVIDMRQDKPKVILQEVLDHNYVVSRAYMNCNYEKMPWGTEAFESTPMGIAHNRLVRELIARVESYIEAAQ